MNLVLWAHSVAYGQMLATRTGWYKCAYKFTCTHMNKSTHIHMNKSTHTRTNKHSTAQEFRSTMQLMSHTGLIGMSVAAVPEIRRASLGQAGKGGGASRAKEGGAALALKVQMKEVHTALKDNVLFKKVLSGLPMS
jgi:hypothetical protein